MIYLVKYVSTPEEDYEGWVHNRKQFLEWLRQHNIERVEEQEISEYADEFELIPLDELTGEPSD